MTILRNALNTTRWRLLPIGLGWLIFGATLFIALAVGALVVHHLLRAELVATLLPGQQLAREIATVIQADTAVQDASGAYVPGEGLILYAKVSALSESAIQRWSQHQLEPFVARLLTLPADEQLIWVIDHTADENSKEPTAQTVVTVALTQVAEPLQYAYMRNSKPTDSTVDQSAPLPTTGVAAPTALPPTAAPPTPIPTMAAPATAIAEGGATVAVDEFSGSVAADAPTPLRSFSFQETEVPATTAAAGWLLLSGNWAVQNGVYSQLDAEGYDYITLLDLPQQRHYSVEVRMRMRSGEMGGGLIYNAPSQESRAGAQIIDVDERGRYLRWGYYDAAGLYTFTGGVTLDAGLADGEWHRLRLVTQESNSIIWFDDREVGRTVNQSLEGYLGLVTSRAQIDFDDLVVIALPPENLSVVP